jgi:hypothetical protein
MIGELKVKPIGNFDKTFYFYTVLATSAKKTLGNQNFVPLEYVESEIENLFMSLLEIYRDDGSEVTEKANDFEILKYDKRFLRLLTATNRRYRNNYDNFLDRLGKYY